MVRLRCFHPMPYLSLVASRSSGAHGNPPGMWQAPLDQFDSPPMWGTTEAGEASEESRQRRVVGNQLQERAGGSQEAHVGKNKIRYRDAVWMLSGYRVGIGTNRVLD
ncbi:hypothetical protein NDU88_004096 [Pleurodeles waltl]|uniref:Uncharacterized protein n=1 Tax=Pleurodeles waltl TaxID=8319 RepID=A0AAV7T6Y9_PLEWA|nr:hypothetical protein NDU88_004096 [Pleurodeles waltl]